MKSAESINRSINELAATATGQVRRLESLAGRAEEREAWGREMGAAYKVLMRNEVPMAAVPWLLSDWSKHILGK